MTDLEKIAKSEPYYCVLSHPQFLLSHIGDSRAAFFESGEREVQHVMQRIRAVGRDATPHHVLEFGCGPGRMIPALAQHGFRVTAVDRSPSMLQLTRENIERFAVSGVEVLDLDVFTRQTSTFDLILVSRVLQQNSVADGIELLRMLTGRLNPGGFLYLNVPFDSSRSPWSRVGLSLRKALPPVNAIANRLRHRPAHIPVLVPTVYPLDQIVLALHTGSCEIAEFRVEIENELTVAHLLTRRTGNIAAGTWDGVESVAASQAPLPDDYISPSDLVRSVGLDELNARAERYFAGSNDWTPQMAKPFSNPTEAPAMLIALGVVLQALSLAPGMTVLDFGGGTGWLSRFLLQFGCRVILCDVASSALKLAKDFVDRHPPIGGKPEDLRFLLFDGSRLDIGDNEIDRIICFDSFHHVPNVEAALREFGRVLKPGGIAAFSEPGPEHSRSAQSQFEMRVYGVLENDVDVRHIWKIARAAGFEDIKLTAFDGAPASMTLDEFDDLLQDGAQLRLTARSLRDFTANVRTFALRKHGVEKTDSRIANGLSSEITISVDAATSDRAPTPFTARVINSGTAAWLPSDQTPGGVSLGAHLYRDGALVNFDFIWVPIGDDTVNPGESVTVHGFIPELPRGRYVIEFDCVAKSVAWFAQAGSRTTRIQVQSSMND